jgi:hypothetical protein
MKRLNVILWIGLIGGVAAPAMAQQPSQRDSAKKAATVPADARPPRGMCRVWIDDVPAAQQPAATDCATAVKNRPTNGRVIFGDDYADTAKRNNLAKPKLPPDAQGFSGGKPPVQLLPKRPPGN